MVLDSGCRLALDKDRTVGFRAGFGACFREWILGVSSIRGFFGQGSIVRLFKGRVVNFAGRRIGFPRVGVLLHSMIWAVALMFSARNV